eukprot:m.260820 g.260820  ORF g.260820 m.260820 type:complete len:134 (+) comp26651_c3_seq4:457-858(+)
MCFSLLRGDAWSKHWVLALMMCVLRYCDRPRSLCTATPPCTDVSGCRWMNTSRGTHVRPDSDRDPSTANTPDCKHGTLLPTCHGSCLCTRTRHPHVNGEEPARAPDARDGEQGGVDRDIHHIIEHIMIQPTDH